MPSKQDSEYWDYWSEIVKASIHRDSHELPAIIQAAQIQGREVLDAGCGPGRLILPFAKFARTITAVDEADWAVNLAEKLARENRLLEKVQVVQAPLVSLPFDDGVSQSTYCIRVIHYDRSRWQKIVKELVRVTQKDSPIVVGVTSGERDLPRLEEFTKPDHVKKCKDFDNVFPAWCKEQGWLVEVKKIILPFEFKSADWAFEVLSHTLLHREPANAKQKEIMHFLRTHSKNGKVYFEQELRLYTIREKE